jgi:hypothetical protein
MQRHIYNSCLGAYPPADEYAKPFYCSAFDLNMKSGQIHRNILNIGMNIRESTIGLTAKFRTLGHAEKKTYTENLTPAKSRDLKTIEMA